MGASADFGVVLEDRDALVMTLLLASWTWAWAVA
jgi:hypothetical protein